MIYLVCEVYLVGRVDLVCLVHLVRLVRLVGGYGWSDWNARCGWREQDGDTMPE
jgi:hypothetical protein